MKRRKEQSIKARPQMPPSLAVPSGQSLFFSTAQQVLSNGRGQHDTLFLGRAGEHYVASELLRRGFNAMVLPVDTGVDVIAHREFTPTVPLLTAEHDLFLFQVKTTSIDEYSASLSIDTVHHLWHKCINLIIVFWPNGTSPTSLVLPPSLIRMLTSGGFDDPKAPLKITKTKVSLRVISRDQRYFLRNRNNDITAMVNRFDRVESTTVDTESFPPYASWSDGPGLISIDDGRC